MSDSRHISDTSSVDATQLGINHLLIRDHYKAWLQVFKNVGRLYKKKKKKKIFHNLMKVVAEEVFDSYFYHIYIKRSNNSNLPDKSELEDDVLHLTKKLIDLFQMKLSFTVTDPKDIRKVQRVVAEAVQFVNYVVLVRPLGSFVWAKVGDEYDKNIHEIKNSRATFEHKPSEIEKMKLVVSKCIYPGYHVDNAIFLKGGVIVEKRDPKKEQKEKYVNLTDVTVSQFKKRASVSPGSMLWSSLRQNMKQQIDSKRRKRFTAITSLLKKSSEKIEKEMSAFGEIKQELSLDDSQINDIKTKKKESKKKREKEKKSRMAEKKEKKSLKERSVDFDKLMEENRKLREEVEELKKNYEDKIKSLEDKIQDQEETIEKKKKDIAKYVRMLMNKK